MRDHVLFVDDRFDLAQEPWIEPGERLYLAHFEAFAEGLRDPENAVRRALADRGGDDFAALAFQFGHAVEPVEPGFEAA
jgi:predicted DNA-binding transcriptional regulator YafY